MIKNSSAATNLILKVLQKSVYIVLRKDNLGKCELQVPDTGTGVLENTRPFFFVLVLFASGCHQHTLKNVNITFSGNTGTLEMLQYTGMFQCLGPEVYFLHNLKTEKRRNYFFQYSAIPDGSLHTVSKKKKKKLAIFLNNL